MQCYESGTLNLKFATQGLCIIPGGGERLTLGSCNGVGVRNAFNCEGRKGTDGCVRSLSNARVACKPVHHGYTDMYIVLCSSVLDEKRECQTGMLKITYLAFERYEEPVLLAECPLTGIRGRTPFYLFLKYTSYTFSSKIPLSTSLPIKPVLPIRIPRATLTKPPTSHTPAPLPPSNSSDSALSHP